MCSHCLFVIIQWFISNVYLFIIIMAHNARATFHVDPMNILFVFWSNLQIDTDRMVLNETKKFSFNQVKSKKKPMSVFKCCIGCEPMGSMCDKHNSEPDYLHPQRQNHQKKQEEVEVQPLIQQKHASDINIMFITNYNHL